MKNFILAFFILIQSGLFAQVDSSSSEKENKGFLFGLGIGGGLLTLQNSNTFKTDLSLSLPNIKLGYRLNNDLAVFATLPGATYKQDGEDRGFEAIMLATQYWVQKRWWISGGLGLTFDAPAFYTVDDFKDAKFYTGFPAVSLSTGYELLKKDRFVLDVKYQLFGAQSNLENNTKRTGISSMIILGFNWY